MPIINYRNGILLSQTQRMTTIFFALLADVPEGEVTTTR